MPRLNLSTYYRDWPHLHPLRSRLQAAFDRPHSATQEILPGDKGHLVYQAHVWQTDQEKYRVAGCYFAAFLDLGFSHPSRSLFGKRLDYELPIVLAHETHHHLRDRATNHDRSFGERLVAEGMASVAEIEIAGPSVVDFYGYNDLSEQEMGALLDRTRPLILSTIFDVDHQDPTLFQRVHWMGRHIVENYRRKNGSPTSYDMLPIPATEILKATFG